MSGGVFDYAGNYIGNRVFFYPISVHYNNLDKPEYCRVARDQNPMEDRDISELLFDIACLIHSCEWYKSGDICEDDYREHLAKFKSKWFGRTDADRLKAYKADLTSYFDSLVAELERGGSNE